MFKLNLKIAFRNLLKHKMAALINVIGLAVGLAASLILLLYVSYEWNYDKQFRGAGDIYRLMVNFHEGKVIKHTAEQTPDALAGALKAEVPEISKIARVTWQGGRLVSNGKQMLRLRGHYVDPEFLHIFRYTYISGDPSALNTPDAILLTETGALKLFGTTQVLNRTLRFENQVALRVAAVIKDLPDNVTFRFECLTNWQLFQRLNDWARNPQWTAYSFNTLVTLKHDTDAPALNNRIRDFISNHSSNNGSKSTVFLYRLTDSHLFGKFENGKPVGGLIEQVKLFSALGFGILILACINFMNLATARAQRRSREVAIRKTVGATRKALVIQFLMESLILTLASFALAIIIVELCLPKFNQLLEIGLKLDYADPDNWLLTLTLLLLTSLIAGSYPAFLLSSFSPVQALKRKMQTGGRHALNVRQVLVVVQFGCSVLLIIATIIIYRQLEFIRNKPLGYEKSLLAEMPQQGLLKEKFAVFREQLLRSGAVTAVSRTSASISNRSWMTAGLRWRGMQESDKDVTFDEIAAERDFLKTNGIRLIEGRDFNPDFASDSAAVLLNQTAVRKMNLRHPIGEQIVHNDIRRTVVGVFADIVWGSPNQAETPMVITYDPGGTSNITMRLGTNRRLQENVAEIGRIAKIFNPEYPAEIRFIDELVERKFKEEKMLSVLSNVFGGLSVFISCMGLFALSAFSAEQRTKEIGVRKVLGATVPGIIGMLSLNFIRTVLVALIVAMPLGYFIMNKWLVKFDYHVPVGADIFLITALSTISLALVTVSWQAWRAARSNPVEALKYE
ncbi:ABC transporter permease [Pedobacter sp. JY14-1]|uniref:ABC transporter permease n=1 Tax=Pedobacter sp. JY14-1 TaxID=3034151 RepID=UPI0023E3230A|nr:ABC transporter permease [Pedobacter sp. JY14-1]